MRRGRIFHKASYALNAGPCELGILRAWSREDVDRCAAVLKEMDAMIVCGPAEGASALDYYSVLFEDPDGIHLELCCVPGAGLLAAGTAFNSGGGYGEPRAAGRGGNLSGQPSATNESFNPEDAADCGN